jgi:hypothetical protein
MEEMPLGLALYSVTTTAAGGLSAQVGLLEDDCGIAAVSGSFTMRRVWAKPGPGDAEVELFEGEVHVKVSYGSMYSSRGFGRGRDNRLAFTGIRKRDAKGEEVGLGPRKCEVSHGGGGGSGYGHGGGSSYGRGGGRSSYGGGFFDDLGFSEEESDGEDSDGNVKGSLRWHYRRSKMGIYNY